MPPRHCLGQLPLRPVVRPASCLARPQFLAQATSAAAFSTSAARFKPPNQKKGNSTAGPPKKGGQGLRIKKAGGGKEGRKGVSSSELKALRKRIVLSNDNALEVPGLADLKAEDVGDLHIQGKVVGIPMDPVVDQLRAVDAFKPIQGWGLFRRPAMLVTEKTLELGRLVSEVQAEDGQKVVKKIIHGERSSGKTTLLLQAMTMAFLKGWVVINFPDAKELTNGETAYAPIAGTNPPQYFQKDYTASLLAAIAKANETVLERLKPTQLSSLPVHVDDNTTLLTLAQAGSKDPEVAWPVFQALWKELTTRSNKEDAAFARPPVMVCVDNVSFALGDSSYIDGDGKPIHAADFALVRHFLDLLSAEPEQLPNGGVVLAATSRSNAPRSSALNFAISSLEAKQSGAGPEDLPKWNPYEKMDERSLSALSKAETLKATGITREEARAIMEYYAKSGLMRRVVDESLVSEKWTMSGGGIIGELERATVRSRI